MIRIIITALTTILSFFIGFLFKKKSEENINLKLQAKSYEKKQELQKQIIDRNIANNNIDDVRLQFKKNRTNYKSKSSK